jgi:hypothetical protein
MTSPEVVQVLVNSKVPRELKNAAAVLAASKSPDDHDDLFRFLSSGEFLSRLDSDEAYQGNASGVRLSYVIDAITRNGFESAQRVLVRLTMAPEYDAQVLRMILLVSALAQVRPSPPEAVKYWADKSMPESPLASDVVEAICINQSDPALSLLEKTFADPGHDASLKVFWMRKHILSRRNDEPLVACCERMLYGSLPADLRPAMVETLFDYRPASWYRGCDPPKPPPRLLASEKVKELLKRIGEDALHTIPLSEEQKIGVRAGLAEFGGNEGKGT